MRLIDADALLKKHCIKGAKGNCKACDWYGDSHCSTEIFGTQIDFAPTIEAEPVKHGRWIQMEDYCGDEYWRCSDCGEDLYYDYDPTSGATKINYCPTCGCKMDLEGEG